MEILHARIPKTTATIRPQGALEVKRKAILRYDGPTMLILRQYIIYIYINIAMYFLWPLRLHRAASSDPKSKNAPFWQISTPNVMKDSEELGQFATPQRLYHLERLSIGRRLSSSHGWREKECKVQVPNPNSNRRGVFFLDEWATSKKNKSDVLLR